ncbi:MAG: glycosyltransferase, partial [candidate division Zixibacteria bacterium]
MSILKLDVDGFEQQVVIGASDLLKGQRVDVIHIDAETNLSESRQCSYRTIDDIMLESGYRLFRVYENKQDLAGDAPFLSGMDLTYVSRHFAESRLDRSNQEFAEVQARQKLLRSLSLLEQEETAKLKREVELLGQELKVSRRSLVKRERHVSVLTQEVAQLKSEPEQLGALIDSMVSSKSWRITAPLRAIVTWARGALNRKPREMSLEELGRGVPGVRRRLNSLGFKQRALEELKLLSKSYNRQQRQFAGWELALWHANLGTKDGAEECLKLLQEVTKENDDPERHRQAAVIEAECHVTLGNTEEAKRAILSALDTEQHADLYLAAANLESSTLDRLAWINKALSLHGLSNISIDDLNGRPLYDRIVSKQVGWRAGEAKFKRSSPKVTVIMPTYNAEDVITTALSSVIAQTWQNLEILVVDDCSTDSTRDIVERFMVDDPRVKLLKAEVNGGPYVARNIALRVATGDYVTCNDSDDWSHPEKIARQVKHLIKTPDLIGNGSQQTRATNDLVFHRRRNAGFYNFNNMSS